jgi:radical SAM superfamily enzyme YgiQ (UPF0313 family)
VRRVVRPVPEVIDEIKGLHSRRVMFLDPNLVSNFEYARELMEALIPLKLKWMAPVPSNVIYEKDLFELMVRSGCVGGLIGFESFSQSSLNRIGKKFNQVSHYKEIVNILHKHGILVSGCFVLGFDDDKPNTLKLTAEKVYEIKIDFPRYALLTPFPGTSLYTRFKKQGRLLTNKWFYYDSQHVVFKPKHMSPVQLQNIFDDTIRKSFSYQHIAHRARIAPHSKLLSVMTNWALREALFSGWKEKPVQTPITSDILMDNP